jgi:Protein of unknown function (DUF664)
MDVNDLLVEAYDRLPGLVRTAVSGLTPGDLRRSPAPGANPVGWLVWHLTRVQDDHVADLLDVPQVWVDDARWARRFGRAPDPADTGYGHSAAQVAAFDPGADDVLVEYFGAVFDRTRRYVSGLGPKDLDRIVDERWDPPVTLGVRLVSILDDDLQHAGQAAYVRGVLERARRMGPAGEG